MREWYLRHPGYNAANVRRWKKNNPEKRKLLASAYAKRWRKRTAPSVLRDRAVQYRENRRRKVRELLGGKCARCGFSDVRALQVDHVNGDGWKQKRLDPLDIYVDVLRKNGAGYQLLCANCNWIKRHENREWGGKEAVN